MSVDVAFWSLGLGMEIAVAALLLIRRSYRPLPFFTVYILWTIASDAAGMFLKFRFPRSFFQVFVANTLVDALLQFAVLVELGWSLLRPLGRSLLRPGLTTLLSLLLLAALFTLPFAGGPRFGGLSRPWHLLLETEQFCAILRVLLCLVLAGCSQLLALGWRDRELQVVTGLGFYSVVTLGASFLHAQPFTRSKWHLIDQCTVVSYLACLLFWIVNLREQERTVPQNAPRIQAFLEMLTHAAHADRRGLEGGQPVPATENNPEASR